MAVVNQEEGSQTATISTLHQLNASAWTTAAVYVLVVDMVNLVNGDTVELWIKTKVRSSGTLQFAYWAVYSHVQTTLNKYSPPVPSDVEVDFFLKQTAGTGRAFPWKILTV